MTTNAKALLAKLASAYDQNQKNNFDFTFYMSFPDAVIDELVARECIIKQNDIVGTIKLTQFGYDEAKK